MAAVGSITLSGNVSGGQTGSRSFGPFTITFANAVDQVTAVALVNGSVTVTVPSGATAVVVFPPNTPNPAPNPAYAGTITLKGVSGDTGVAVSNKYPTMLSWDTAPASFVLTASAAGTLEAWFA